MNILVTGGNGFLGKRVVKHLSEAGHKVRVLVIPEEDTTYLATLNIEIIRGDMTVKETIKGICDDIETVVHLAAILTTSDHHLNFLINYEGTKNIADLADEAGVKKFVFTSSMTVTGKNPNEYGLSKKKAEEYLATKNFIKIIIRPTLLYGKEGFGFQKMIELSSMLPFIVPMIGSGSARKQPIYVEDAAKILTKAALLEFRGNKVYEMGGPEAESVKDIIKRILKIRGQKKMFFHIPRWFLFMGCYFAEKALKNPPLTRDAILQFEMPIEVDHKMIEEDFDIKLTSFDEGLRKSV